MKGCVALVLLAFLALGGCSRKADDPLDELLWRLGREARQFRAFQVAFAEEKEIPGFSGPVRITGELAGRVDARGMWLRLEARTPAPSSILLTPEEVRIWSPLERHFERSPLERSGAFVGLFHGILLFYGSSRKEIERDFQVTARRLEGGVGTEIVIGSREPRGGLEGDVRTLWKGEEPFPSELSFAVGEERFRWRFSGFRALREVDEGVFELAPPEGIEPVEIPAEGHRQ